jgi:hypothetical protein
MVNLQVFFLKDLTGQKLLRIISSKSCSSEAKELILSGIQHIFPLSESSFRDDDVTLSLCSKYDVKRGLRYSKISKMSLN